jgi:hypothetical protein
MTTLADRPQELRTAQLFGSSGRNPYRGPYSERRDGWGDEDDDRDRPAASSSYRTLCVRLCDGYYFPISFAAPSDRLRRDRDLCASRCGAQGRLYLHKSVGETPEDMVDLQGRPYRQLPTAFLYRTEYVASCKCQADPWEAASLDRHRAYALAAAAGKGNKEAAKELQGVQARMKEAALVEKAGAGNGAKPEASAAAAAARRADIGRREDGAIMGLGSNAKAGGKAAAVPATRARGDDWMRSIFEPGAGR